MKKYNVLFKDVKLVHVKTKQMLHANHVTLEEGMQ